MGDSGARPRARRRARRTHSTAAGGSADFTSCRPARIASCAAHSARARAPEATRKRNQTDATFQKFAAKLASLVRKPVAIELFEIVVPMPGMATPPVAARAKRKAK